MLRLDNPADVLSEESKYTKILLEVLMDKIEFLLQSTSDGEVQLVDEYLEDCADVLRKLTTSAVSKQNIIQKLKTEYESFGSSNGKSIWKQLENVYEETNSMKNTYQMLRRRCTDDLHKLHEEIRLRERNDQTETVNWKCRRKELLSNLTSIESDLQDNWVLLYNNRFTIHLPEAVVTQQNRVDSRHHIVKELLDETTGRESKSTKYNQFLVAANHHKSRLESTYLNTKALVEGLYLFVVFSEIAYYKNNK